MNTMQTIEPNKNGIPQSLKSGYYDVVKKSETNESENLQKLSSADLPKIDHGKQCNARRKNKENPGYCKKPAGWGTWHVGHGRCKLHGGSSPMKHGLSSEMARYAPNIKSLIEQMKGNPETYQISNQAAVQMALLQNKLDAITKRQMAIQGKEDGSTEITETEWEAVLKMSKEMTKTLERKARIEQSERQSVPIETLDLLIQGVSSVIEMFVPDKKTRAKISEALMRLPIPRGVVVKRQMNEDIEDAVIIEEDA